jgi:hypothetical protein
MQLLAALLGWPTSAPAGSGHMAGDGMQLLQRWVSNTTVANLYRFGRRQGKYSRSQQQVTTVWHSVAVP